MQMRAANTKEKFESLFWVSPSCWNWSGPTNPRGYGVFSLGKNKLAHRISYELYVGPIEIDKCILHMCDTPGCVNPDHLSVGTKTENALDRDLKGRTAKGERNGRARLTKADVLKIRDDTRVLRLIAEDYGVNRTTIHFIKTRKTWSSI